MTLYTCDVVPELLLLGHLEPPVFVLAVNLVAESAHASLRVMQLLIRGSPASNHSLLVDRSKDPVWCGLLPTMLL